MAVKEFCEQLPLSIALRDDCALDTFYAGDNQHIVSHLSLIAKGQGEQFTYLWGKEGVGRSHLLQGVCHDAARFGLGAVYLPLATLTHRAPLQLVEGLERLNIVCLDDIDAICGNSAWEEALFYLYNRLRSVNHRLLVAAQCPPAKLEMKLADLKSRLSWGVTYHLHPLNDEQLIGALQLRARQRGLELSDEVGLFLLRRNMRSMPHLYELLERLDKASLAAQRRLTIPFIKEVLDL
ncbi:MAG: DnaA regulatory inactivator Hda [Proteobacteria bacterium]|nr:DnaA regulatory inactivator Hda [Pseudomonadota bacterium]